VEAFKIATEENARNSISNEPGVARFDVLQQADDPTRFILLEVYHTPEDAAKHKETLHYSQWRNIAEPMMAEPRSRKIYTNIFPTDSGYL
jgi:quinol monooxygenase YgiN